MTFEQADRLCTRVIEFMREMGGPYPQMDEGYLQWCILSCLANRQFVIRIDRQGIRYFACWWWLDKESLENFATDQPEERIRPQSVTCGPLCYVAEVVSRGEDGDAKEMIKRMRRICGDTKNAYWHQAHRNNRLCSRRDK